MNRLLLLLGTVLFSQISFSQEAYTLEPSKTELKTLGIGENQRVPQGLVPGQTCPQFNAKSVSGEKINSQAKLRNGGLVVIFYQGTWRNDDVNFLKNLSDSIANVKELGVEVIAITPELERWIKFGRTEGSGLNVISDSDGILMKQFNQGYKVSPEKVKSLNSELGVNFTEKNGPTGAFLPVPGAYVVHPNGKITWRSFDYDEYIGTSVKELVRELNELGLGDKEEEKE